MSNSIKKIIASTLAIATVAGTLVASSGSAQAGWHGGHGGFGWGAAGILGGLALGAVVASNSYAQPSCGYVRQRVYDANGYFMGYRTVPAC